MSWTSPSNPNRYTANPLDFSGELWNYLQELSRRIEELEGGTPGTPGTPPPPGTPHPDLILTALSASPSSPTVGDPVTFTFTVLNQGNDPVPSGTSINVNIYVDNVAVTHGNFLGGLNPGASATWDTVTSSGAGGTWVATQGTHAVQARVNDGGSIVEANTTNNSRDLPGGLVVTTPPAGIADLVVASLTSSPGSPVQGGTVTFSFTLTNQGSAAVAPGTNIPTAIAVDGTTVVTVNFTAGLGIGATSATLTGTWVATAGTHTVVTTVNPAGTIPESTNANNTRSISVTVGGTASGVDLVVTALSASPSAPNPGDPVTFTITVQNIGGATMPAQTSPVMGVGIYIDGAVAATTWANFNTALAAGATITLDTVTSLFPGGLWTATAGAHTIDAFVNDGNVFAETDRTNNHRTMTLTVNAPSVAGDITSRGTTNAITAGTTLASGSFTPAAGSLIVVVVEGTTI